jgi:uncharacterized protein (TIGR03083 family)
MDHIEHFRREATAFEAAARAATAADVAPDVPTCPAWVLTDLVLHLGTVHRFVTAVIAGRLTAPPEPPHIPGFDLPVEFAGWLPPQHAPPARPLPPALVTWFAEGADLLEEQFRTVPAEEPVWTWWRDRSVGFWVRMQAIEAAVHRWDAEHAMGAPAPLHPDLAADAVSQIFEVMLPSRRERIRALPGRGERFRFRRTDGTQSWTIRFDADKIVTDDPTGPADLEVSGTASDLALFQWQRIRADQVHLDGDPTLVTRFFELAPPI